MFHPVIESGLRVDSYVTPDSDCESLNFQFFFITHTSNVIAVIVKQGLQQRACLAVNCLYGSTKHIFIHILPMSPQT